MRLTVNLFLHVVGETCRLAGWLLLVLLCALFFSACATTDSNESDIPWNAPQPWEGSPMIPGMERM